MASSSAQSQSSTGDIIFTQPAEANSALNLKTLALIGLAGLVIYLLIKRKR